MAGPGTAPFVRPRATDQRAGGTWLPRGTRHWREPTGCCRQVEASAVRSGDCGSSPAQLPAAFPDQPNQCRPALAFALAAWPGRPGLQAAGVRPTPPRLVPPCPVDGGGGRAALPSVRVLGAGPLAPLPPPLKNTTTSHALRRQTRPKGWWQEIPEKVSATQRLVAVSERNGGPGSSARSAAVAHGDAQPHVSQKRRSDERTCALATHRA